ncbi:MAG TPA: cupin domain-containing protein [Puia sp.]|jgi:mannose-6-phosphate isomerase-like protein (cupin superfamily)|nr:cupin domain-containing protein [Puia sp.]
MNPVVSRLNPLKHYLWGDNCDGWNFVDQPDLSVKMERMPPHTAEESHYHELARQFFFILKGTAVFEFSGDGGAGGDGASGGGIGGDDIGAGGIGAGPAANGRVTVAAQQGLEIAPLLRHRIINETEEDLEFILCSQPSTAGDRILTNDKI